MTGAARRSGPRAERRGGLPSRGSSVRPEAADDAHDDGDVEEDVRERIAQSVRSSAVGQQREERGRDDDRRQHERHEHERPRAAGRGSEARERPGERQPGDERERGRDSRLPEREPRDSSVEPASSTSNGEIEPPSPEARARGSRAAGQAKKTREERDAGRQRRRAAAAQRTTISVHSSTQRSRFVVDLVGRERRAGRRAIAHSRTRRAARRPRAPGRRTSSRARRPGTPRRA